MNKKFKTAEANPQAEKLAEMLNKLDEQQLTTIHDIALGMALNDEIRKTA